MTWLEQLELMVNGLILADSVASYRKENNIIGENQFRVRVSTVDTKDSIVCPALVSQDDWETLKDLPHDNEKPLSMNMLNDSMRVVHNHLSECDEKCQDELIVEKSMTVEEVLGVCWNSYKVIWDYLLWFNESKVEKPTVAKITRKGKF